MFYGYYDHLPGEEPNPWDECPPEYYEQSLELQAELDEYEAEKARSEARKSVY